MNEILKHTIMYRREVVKKMLGFYQVKPNIMEGIKGDTWSWFS